MNPLNAFIVVVEKSGQRIYWGRPKKISEALEEFDKKCRQYTDFGHGLYKLYKDEEIDRMAMIAMQFGINPLRQFENFAFLSQRENITVKLAHKLFV